MTRKVLGDSSAGLPNSFRSSRRFGPMRPVGARNWPTGADSRARGGSSRSWSAHLARAVSPCNRAAGLWSAHLLGCRAIAGWPRTTSVWCRRARHSSNSSQLASCSVGYPFTAHKIPAVNHNIGRRCPVAPVPLVSRPVTPALLTLPVSRHVVPQRDGDAHGSRGHARWHRGPATASGDSRPQLR